MAVTGFGLKFFPVPQTKSNYIGHKSTFDHIHFARRIFEFRFRSRPRVRASPRKSMTGPAVQDDVGNVLPVATGSRFTHQCDLGFEFRFRSRPTVMTSHRKSVSGPEVHVGRQNGGDPVPVSQHPSLYSTVSISTPTTEQCF